MEHAVSARAGALLALCCALAGGTPPAGAQESLETQREMDAARAAESQPATHAAPVPVGELGAGGPLFVGVDDVAIPAFRIDPTIPASTPVPLGVQIWGAAYDPGSDTVYIISGSVLNSWVVGAPGVTPIGTITDANGGATLAMVSAAFTNGTLYSTRNIGTEGLYSIDTATAVATLVAVPSVPTGDIDTGGLAADPFTGVLYATNDDTSFPGGRGLITFALDGTVALVAPYPAGETDIDGLSIGTDGRAYLVEDDSIAASGNIHVYNLTGGVYETPIPTPWPTSETFSAGAWIGVPTCELVLTCPADVVVSAPPGAPSTTVTYDPPVVEGTCTSVTTTCAPASGDDFPVGDTTVTCDALDDQTGTTASCQFLVTVEPTALPVVEIPAASSLGLAALALLLLGFAAAFLRRG